MVGTHGGSGLLTDLFDVLYLRLFVSERGRGRCIRALCSATITPYPTVGNRPKF